MITNGTDYWKKALFLLCVAAALLSGCSQEKSDGLKVGQADFQISGSISEAIPTVGIVEWSVELDAFDTATVEFGLDNQYGKEAAVDKSAPNLRTVVLGMKPSSTYHYRVAVISGDTIYYSEDRILETGPVMNGLPSKAVETSDASATAGGYVISNFVGDSTVFILDEDGDYVWWYETSVAEATRARLSWDGKHMLVGANNVENNGEGELLKISMDGLSEESIHLPGLHHDFTVLPENEVAFIEYDEDGEGVCDRIVEIREDGTRREVYSLREDFSHLSLDQEWCHSNAIHYDVDDVAYYMSVLEFNAIVKVNAEAGELAWVLGGDESDFDEEEWYYQHGFHVLDGGILIFNNGGNMWTNHSLALEMTLDEQNMGADVEWQYEGGPIANFQGDVQRLPNGNTLVTYSSAGIIHEVDSEGDLLKDISWSVGGATGYAMWRESLYGPPPK